MKDGTSDSRVYVISDNFTHILSFVSAIETKMRQYIKDAILIYI
jgi:hypothetical protein